MWIITKTGFVSLVEHKDNPDQIRVRARRREHLVETFHLSDHEVIDLGVNCPDYRWHADLARDHVQMFISDAIADLDYSSHVKEEVTGDDKTFYAAMLRCWNALYTLQHDPKPEHDWWNRPPAVNDSWRDDWYGRTETEPTLTELSDSLADRMTRVSTDLPDEDGDPYLEDEVYDAIHAVVGENLDAETIAAIRDAVLEIV